MQHRGHKSINIQSFGFDTAPELPEYVANPALPRQGRQPDCVLHKMFLIYALPTATEAETAGLKVGPDVRVHKEGGEKFRGCCLCIYIERGKFV